MLYKIAGPFDVIFCGEAYLPLRPMLEQLLAPDGVLITNGEPYHTDRLGSDTASARRSSESRS